MLRNLGQNVFNIIQYLIVCESQDADALTDHIGVAVLIVMPLVPIFVY